LTGILDPGSPSCMNQFQSLALDIDYLLWKFLNRYLPAYLALAHTVQWACQAATYISDDRPLPWLLLAIMVYLPTMVLKILFSRDLPSSGLWKRKTRHSCQDFYYQVYNCKIMRDDGRDFGATGVGTGEGFQSPKDITVRPLLNTGCFYSDFQRQMKDLVDVCSLMSY
jgi:hypothetical protein